LIKNSIFLDPGFSVGLIGKCPVGFRVTAQKIGSIGLKRSVAYGKLPGPGLTAIMPLKID
jgi:hypothetical protein